MATDPNSLDEKKRKPETDEDIRKFMKTYELTQMTRGDMVEIYKRNILTPGFSKSISSALLLILLPGLTNIYYTFRPNSVLSRIMPFAVPVGCLLTHMLFVDEEIKNFCFTNTQDSIELRKKFEILYLYEQQLSERKDFISLLNDYQKANNNDQKMNSNNQKL